MDQEIKDYFEERISKLEGRQTVNEAKQAATDERVEKVETAVIGLENKLVLFKVDLADQSRWLQTMSEKIDLAVRGIDGVKALAESVSSSFTDLNRNFNARMNELLKEYQRDTIPVQPMSEADIHDETTVTGVPKPTGRPPSE